MLLALGLEVQTFSLMVRALDLYAKDREFKPRVAKVFGLRPSIWGGSRMIPDYVVGFYKMVENSESIARCSDASEEDGFPEKV